MSEIMGRTAKPTFAEGCRGFAAFFRSESYSPGDEEMVANKFDAVADRIEELERELAEARASIANHYSVFDDIPNVVTRAVTEARNAALEDAAKVAEAELAKYDCMNEDALARGWYTVSVEAKSKIAVLAPLVAAIRALKEPT